MKRSLALALLLTLLLLLTSCGLEDFPLIYPVPQSSISREFNSRSVVYVPTSNAGTTFSHFAIFYRIYVSNSDQPSTISDAAYSAINSYLAADHSAVFPYIDSTTLVNRNMDDFFSSRGFHYLNLEGHNINSVLSTSALGSTIEFNFPSRTAPTMTIDSNVYTLWRSDGNRQFDPQPNRLFVNHDDLWNPANINDSINRDVVNMPGIGTGDRRYTYAAMYIVGVGIDVATYSFMYSTPSLIHVFQLPDRW